MDSLNPSMTSLFQENVQHVKFLLAEAEWKYTVGPNIVLPSRDGRVAQFQRAITFAQIRFSELIAGKRFFCPWESSSAPSDVAEHLKRLNVPTINGAPSLLCHKLGESTSSDFDNVRSQKARLGTIFIEPKTDDDVEHSLLFNTAGAGKTRLVLEGLCHKWGFYFTCQKLNDEGGSRDVGYVIQPKGYLEQCGLVVKDDITVGERTRNEVCAQQCFLAVLAARLLVFQALLAAYEVHLQDSTRTGKNVDTSYMRKIWLFAQLDKSLLAHPEGYKDLFVELSALLCYITQDLGLYLMIQSIVGDIRRFLRGLQAREGQTGNNVHLFCVIDEAQVAASAYTRAFRSSAKDQHRPALRALLQQWAEFFGLIVTGTSLNLASITTAISSSVGKSGNMQKVAVNDTGAFTNHTKIDAYMDYYLPPGYSRSNSGQELRRRAKYWLNGRPRFMASFMETLIRNNFQSPHRLLTLYIKAITGGFFANDAADWEAKEERIPPSIVGRVISFDFARAEQLGHDKLSQLCQVVNSHLFEGKPRTTADSKVDERFVEATFARIEPDGSEPVLDEPLAHMAAREWANNLYSTHQHCISDIEKGSPSFNGLEQYTALVLANTFKVYTKLSEIFRFADGSDSRGLGDLKARLVSCWIDSQKAVKTAPVIFPITPPSEKAEPTSSPSKILGFNSCDPEDDLSWLKFEINAPFLFPHKNFGPDLIFRLQLETGELITVAIQVKWRESGRHYTEPSELTKVINTVQIKEFWKDKNGGVYCPVSYPTLRQDTLKALDQLPNRFSRDEDGYHSVVCGLFGFPATDAANTNDGVCDKILKHIKEKTVTIDYEHEFFVLPTKHFVETTAEFSPPNALARMEETARKRKPKRKKQDDMMDVDEEGSAMLVSEKLKVKRRRV